MSLVTEFIWLETSITLDEFLKLTGFTQLNADSCVYTQKFDGDMFVFILVYVDDMLVVSNNFEALLQQKRKLASIFDLVDQGEVHHLLGMTINRDREKRSCKLSQRSCAVSVVRKFRMEECNPVATPMEANLKLQKLDESETEVTV